MMFGLRFDLRHPAFSPVTPSERYRACVEMREWADERGAFFIGLSEHHGSEDGYLPAPLPLAAAIAARTRHTMINVGALIAPFHDPLRLAEDVAVVDLISGGRLSLIIGGGYVPSEFEMFDVAMSERPRRVTEAVATMRSAWTGARLAPPPPVRVDVPRLTRPGTSHQERHRRPRKY